VEMIGDHAESLPHCFSTKDRPLFESIDDPVVRMQLLEIEAANLLEQDASPGVLRKLARLKLSAGAKAALNSGVV